MTNMPDPASPALSDDELRETLDLMATAVASMSDRIDELTRVADKQIKVSTEARIAAFAAKAQTDPKAFGTLFARTLAGENHDNLLRMGQMVVDLFEASNAATGTLKLVEKDKLDFVRDLQAREQKIQRWKSRLPWFGLGALVLALAMTAVLPRFVADNPSGCAALGATWTTTTEGYGACVFY